MKKESLKKTDHLLKIISILLSWSCLIGAILLGVGGWFSYSALMILISLNLYVLYLQVIHYYIYSKINPPIKKQSFIRKYMKAFLILSNIVITIFIGIPLQLLLWKSESISYYQAIIWYPYLWVIYYIFTIYLVTKFARLIDKYIFCRVQT